MSNQSYCIYINENNEIKEGYEKSVYYYVVNKYPIISYQSYYDVWGYTDELEYKKLSIYIPYDHQDIHDFLNTQIQRYIQAKLLSIL